MASRSLPAALLAAAACATAGTPPPAPHSFQGVRTFALVRRVDDARAAHGKDPLDALLESLSGRGWTARLVEIGRGRSAAREVERLYSQVEGLVAAAPPPGRTGSRTSRVGEADAAAALEALGADGMAIYHRLRGLPTILPAPPRSPLDPLSSPGMLHPSGAGEVVRRPVGALSLVDRDGHVVWVSWGAPTSADEEAPANAAEAIDVLLRVLDGQDDG